MKTASSYIRKIYDVLSSKCHWEKEFIQAVEELLSSITLVLDREPIYQNECILERMIEPERIAIFRVPWRNDRGVIQVNTGYRIGFNSALGPYKGGLRFHASVNLSILKFLGFEQIFKNALTGMSLGGGKGGSDFSTYGKTDGEVERFCQSFMTGLYTHIGPDRDVPAGDIGVGAREIGYLFGQYKRLKNVFHGTITGKGINWGGSAVRPEATGYGAVYFAEEMLNRLDESMKGKIVAVSGFGNVAWGVVKKSTEMGAKVVTLSGPDGFIYDKNGIEGEKIDYMLKMRLSGRDCVEAYHDKFRVNFYSNKRPWAVKCDVAFPCACENELGLNDAKALVESGSCLCVVEGANMPLTPNAVGYLMNHDILYAPGKASNAGGVTCSGFEMAQNSIKIKWSKEEIDEKLRQVMQRIHKDCVEVAKNYGTPNNYVNGANIAGFKRVADAMLDQGTV